VSLAVRVRHWEPTWDSSCSGQRAWAIEEKEEGDGRRFGGARFFLAGVTFRARTAPCFDALTPDGVAALGCCS
jgi:hypothetical protein